MLWRHLLRGGGRWRRRLSSARGGDRPDDPFDHDDLRVALDDLPGVGPLSEIKAYYAPLENVSQWGCRAGRAMPWIMPSIPSLRKLSMPLVCHKPIGLREHASFRRALAMPPDSRIPKYRPGMYFNPKRVLAWDMLGPIAESVVHRDGTAQFFCEVEIEKNISERHKEALTTRWVPPLSAHPYSIMLRYVLHLINEFIIRGQYLQVASLFEHYSLVEPRLRFSPVVVSRVIMALAHMGMLMHAQQLIEDLLREVPRMVKIGLLNNVLRMHCVRKHNQLVSELEEKIFKSPYLRPNMFSFVLLFEHHSRRGQTSRLSELLMKMAELGLKPNENIFAILIRLKAAAGLFHQIDPILKIMEDTGIGFTMAGRAELAKAYIQRRRQDLLRELLADMRRRHIIPDTQFYNALMFGFTKRGDHITSWVLYQEMKALGIQPNRQTFAIAIQNFKTCSARQTPDPQAAITHQKHAAAILTDMAEHLVQPDVYIYSSLLQAFGRPCDIRAFLHTLRSMQGAGVAPSIACYTDVVNAYGIRMHNLAVVKDVLSEVGHLNIETDTPFATAVMSAFLVMGKEADVPGLFERLVVGQRRDADYRCLGVLAIALLRLGDLQKAKEIALQLAKVQGYHVDPIDSLRHFLEYCFAENLDKETGPDVIRSLRAAIAELRMMMDS